MRHHRVTIPRPKKVYKFTLTTVKLPTVYEIRRMACP